MRSIRTPENARKFLERLEETGVVRHALEQVGIARSAAYAWKREDPAFHEAWERSLEVGISALEDEAHRRAFEGTDKPVYQQGVEVGRIREYSDTLAIFLLKAHRPERYRERVQTDVTNSDGSLKPASDAEAAARMAAIMAAAAARRGEADGSDLA